MRIFLIVLLSVIQFFGYSQTWTNYTVYSTKGKLKSKIVSAVAFTADGKAWVGTSWGGLHSYDGSNWVNYDSLLNNSSNDTLGIGTTNILSLNVDSKNNLWVGTSSGLTRFNGNYWRKYSSINTGYLLPSNNIYNIVEDRSGAIWVMTSNGIGKLVGENWTSYTNASEQGIYSDYVYSMCESQNNDKWFPTYNGISRFNGTTWTGFWKSNTGNGTGLSSDEVFECAADSSGNLWFGTNSALTKFDGTTWTKITTANSNNVMGGQFIYDLEVSKQGVLWVGGSGITSFDGQTWIRYTKPNGDTTKLLSNTVNDIEIRDDGSVWVGTAEGLSVLNLSGITKVDEDLSNASKVNIFPNPAQDRITVSFNHSIENGSIILIDIMGSKIKQIPFSGNSYVLETDNLENGIYFIEVVSKSGSTLNKIIIE